MLDLFRDPPSVTGTRALTPSESCSSLCNVLLRPRLRAVGAALGQPRAGDIHPHPTSKQCGPFTGDAVICGSKQDSKNTFHAVQLAA